MQVRKYRKNTGLHYLWKNLMKNRFKVAKERYKIGDIVKVSSIGDIAIVKIDSDVIQHLNAATASVYIIKSNIKSAPKYMKTFFLDLNEATFSEPYPAFELKKEFENE